MSGVLASRHRRDRFGPQRSAPIVPLRANDRPIREIRSIQFDGKKPEAFRFRDTSRPAAIGEKGKWLKREGRANPERCARGFPPRQLLRDPFESPFKPTAAYHDNLLPEISFLVASRLVPRAPVYEAPNEIIMRAEFLIGRAREIASISRLFLKVVTSS